MMIGAPISTTLDLHSEASMVATRELIYLHCIGIEFDTSHSEPQWREVDEETLLIKLHPGMEMYALPMRPSAAARNGPKFETICLVKCIPPVCPPLEEDGNFPAQGRLFLSRVWYTLLSWVESTNNGIRFSSVPWGEHRCGGWQSAIYLRRSSGHCRHVDGRKLIVEGHVG